MISLGAGEEQGTSGWKEEGPRSLQETLCALPLSLQIILDTKFWTVLSFLMVTASLLFFCLFSFLTQSIDAFRVAPAIFRFPGEMSQSSPRSFPSLARGAQAGLGPVSCFPPCRSFLHPHFSTLLSRFFTPI